MVERGVRRLIRAFVPQRIMLFGSYAKNTAHDRSDFDLLIVCDLHGDADAHVRRARQLTADCFPRVDVVLATPQELLNAHSDKSPFLASILGSAVLVYGRDPG